MTIKIERWKSIPGFTGTYEASDLGNVRSLDRIVEDQFKSRSRRRLFTGVTLRQYFNKSGYYYVTLRKNNTGCTVALTKAVHTLVLATFVGPRPDGYESMHKNGDSKDNRLINLRYGTHKENIADRERHNPFPVGSDHYLAKLTEKSVVKIRSMYTSGRHTMQSLASKYHMSHAAITNIVRGYTWAHVGGKVELNVRVRGTSHGCSKITDADAYKIVRLYSSGKFMQKDLGEKFAVAQTTISRILRRELGAL